MNDDESMNDFVSSYESLHENEGNERTDTSNTSNTDTNNPDTQDTADNDTHEDADDANDTNDSKDTEDGSNTDNEYDSRETNSNSGSDNMDAKSDEQDNEKQDEDAHHQENTLPSNAEIQKLCESITQLHAALDGFAQTTTQLASISAQLNISNAKIDQLTASLSSLQSDTLKKHCEEMSQTYHHLENTNKKYTEMITDMNTQYLNLMNAFPDAAEKKYTVMVKKHAAHYQKLLERVSHVIERELLPDSQKTSYYVFAAIALIQTALLFLLLHH